MKNTKLRDLGEFGLIARLNERLTQRSGVRLGIGDDAALLATLRAPLVTCDCLVENVHFRRDWTTPRQLGRKALAVNVSDIAAMGGRPVAAFVTLALGPHDDLNFVQELYNGLEDAAALYEMTIAGGDTSRAPAGLMLSVTVVGDAALSDAAPSNAAPGSAAGQSPQPDEAASPLLRNGARPGDVLLVTGTLGDAAAGLALLQNPGADVPDQTRAYLLARHHEPQARLREAWAARRVLVQRDTRESGSHNDAAGDAGASRAVRASLDLSDGLAGDAAHIARRSAVGIEIEAARLPVSEPCRAAAQALGADANDWALSGGEDYQLLWCVAPEAAEDVIEAVRQATGTPVTRVGQCVAPGGPAVVVIESDGQRHAAPGAFQHF